MTEKLIVATVETVQMVGISILWTVLFGLPLGVVLYASGPQGTRPRPSLHRVLSVVVNIGRSAPFVILMVAITPVTRLLVGTTIGSAAAIVPLAVAAVPFFARLVESALLSVDPGLIEAAESMGANHSGIVRRVLIPEAMPGLIRGLTVTVVAVIGYSAVAGVIGAGGLGDLAIRYGYQRYDTAYMIAPLVLLVLMVQLFQFLGDRTAHRLDHR